MTSGQLRSADLVRLLAERDRRRVVAALILAPGTLDDVAGTTGLSPRSVTEAMTRLVAGGLVEVGSDGIHVVLESAFAAAARSEAAAPPPSEHAHEPPEIAQVLDQAIRDGRLQQWPSKRSKRLIVLDHVAQVFEPGERYTERQVNALLVSLDPDVATTRRYLVDEGFLDRGGGTYWRSGGTVE